MVVVSSTMPWGPNRPAASAYVASLIACVAEQFGRDGVGGAPRRRRSPAPHRRRAGRAHASSTPARMASPRWAANSNFALVERPGGADRHLGHVGGQRRGEADLAAERRHRLAEVRCVHPHAERSDQPEPGDLRPAQQSLRTARPARRSGDRCRCPGGGSSHHGVTRVGTVPSRPRPPRRGGACAGRAGRRCAARPSVDERRSRRAVGR